MTFTFLNLNNLSWNGLNLDFDLMSSKAISESNDMSLIKLKNCVWMIFKPQISVLNSIHDVMLVLSHLDI